MPALLTGEALALDEFLSDPTVKIVAHLAKNAIDWVKDQVTLLTLVECDFLGYVPFEIEDWTVFESDVEDMAEALSGIVQFESWEGITPQTATALYLTVKRGDDAAKLWHVFPLSPPQQFETGERPLQKQVRVTSIDAPVPEE